MTVDEMKECADRLEGKAEDVREGMYDPSEPGENESWEGDLRHAAYLLREGRIQDLNQSEREEIEAIGYDCQFPNCALCDSVATALVAGTPYCETHGNEFRAYLSDQVVGGAQ